MDGGDLCVEWSARLAWVMIGTEGGRRRDNVPAHARTCRCIAWKGRCDVVLLVFWPEKLVSPGVAVYLYIDTMGLAPSYIAKHPRTDRHRSTPVNTLADSPSTPHKTQPAPSKSQHSPPQSQIVDKASPTHSSKAQRSQGQIGRLQKCSGDRAEDCSKRRSGGQ